MQDIDERDLGLQPLDKMMGEWGIDNHQLVEVSTEQLTHKQVQKARKGRRLTLKMMQKSPGLSMWLFGVSSATSKKKRIMSICIVICLIMPKVMMLIG